MTLAIVTSRPHRAAAISAAAYCPDTEEREFLRLINDFRAAAGVGKLKLSSSLGAAAVDHSRDMIARGFFGHVNPDGDGPGDRAAAHGYPSRYVGENIARGTTTAAAAFAIWEGSPGHRENMLLGSYGAIGIGRAQGAGWYWTTVFGDEFDASPACGGPNPDPDPDPGPAPDRPPKHCDHRPNPQRCRRRWRQHH